MIAEVLSLERLRSMAPGEVAALWMFRRREDDSGREAAVFAQWLALDEAHVRAWEEAQGALSWIDDARDDDLIASMRAHALQARPVAAVGWARISAIAAVLIACIAGAFLLSYARDGAWWGAGKREPQVIASGSALDASTEYATVRGEIKQFTLPDGSRLTLDTDSAVTADFHAERRVLRLLRGRGFFDVKHDAARPFSVQAGTRVVSALGTRFDVRLEPASLRVVLVEGRVSVASDAAPSKPVMLRAGEQLVAYGEKAPTVSQADLQAAANWQQGLATFNDVTLSQAAGELNRYSIRQLVIRDPRVAGMRITGIFRAGDIDRFGRSLTQVHPVVIRDVGGNRLEIVLQPGH